MDYQSRKWDRKREKILRRDHYMCQMSKRYGKMVEATVVHHIYPVEDYPEYQWCDWNLISISQGWHNKIHNRETGALTEIGRELMERTALQMGIPPGSKK